MFFVTWLAMVVALALCKLRHLLQRLPGHMPYVAVWLLIVLIVLLASATARWLDGALQTGLIGSPMIAFVRDNTIIAALLGAAMLRYFYVLAQWQARLAAVTRAQVEALQARIRPHFLFNSMNTVAALIRVDPAAAERTVEDLSELFRAALGSPDRGDGTLGEELELIERYLAIEQLRLGPRLRIRRELHDLPADFPLPRLLLQPLVENAVRHGIQPLREGGEVMLGGARDGDGIRIEIRNPLPPQPGVAGNGHGLRSVRQRVAFRARWSRPGPATASTSCCCACPEHRRDARADRRRRAAGARAHGRAAGRMQRRAAGGHARRRRSRAGGARRTAA
jgi:two-component system sensor histidine kinase AlgZ